MTNTTMTNKNKKNKAYDLSGYAFHKGEIVLIDTNIWLYLNPPPSKNTRPLSKNTRRASFIYSRGLKAMLSMKAQLVMDALG